MWRNSRQNNAEFLRCVRFFSVDNARIGKPDEWLQYSKFWQQQRDQLRKAINDVGFADTSEETIRRFRLMEVFTAHISDVLATLSDVVQPRTLKDFLEYGFDDPAENLVAAKAPRDDS